MNNALYHSFNTIQVSLPITIYLNSMLIFNIIKVMIRDLEKIALKTDSLTSKM